MAHQLQATLFNLHENVFFFVFKLKIHSWVTLKVCKASACFQQRQEHKCRFLKRFFILLWGKGHLVQKKKGNYNLHCTLCERSRVRTYDCDVQHFGINFFSRFFICSKTWLKVEQVSFWLATIFQAIFQSQFKASKSQLQNFLNCPDFFIIFTWNNWKQSSFKLEIFLLKYFLLKVIWSLEVFKE